MDLLISGILSAVTLTAQPACSVVPVSDGRIPGNNAAAIATKLNNLTNSLVVRALTDSQLIVCGANDSTLSELRRAVSTMSAVTPVAPPQVPQSEQHSMRLFFHRSASDLATALSDVYTGLKIKNLGTDTLVFQTSDPAQEKNIHELKRWIAHIDAPRPEVALNIWSVQLSADRRDGLIAPADQVRGVVARYNSQLQQALERAWGYLDSIRRQSTYPHQRFANYITRAYRGQSVGPQDAAGTLARAAVRRTGAACSPTEYCLGFDTAFNPLQPALTHMLGVLSAAQTPLSVSMGFVDRLEGGPQLSTGTGEDCEALDYKAPSGRPAFHCLREQLRFSMAPKRLALLRRSIADFLFQYKFSIQYPHEFEPYDLSTSAQALDQQFDPLLVAFNRDVAVYLRRLQEEVQTTVGRSVRFTNEGIVTVRSIAGIDTQVDATTQSAFRNTPPPLVQDFLSRLTAAEAAGGVPQLVAQNLEGHAARALIAFLNAGRSSTVNIGRALNLKITPVSLPGASAAELKLQLENKDDGTPQAVAADGSVKNDTTSRVSNQKVETTVRVESLKLFEVSSFSANLSRGRDPIPLLPPFVELPYIGSFLKWKLPPATMYHRTFAIISAVVVPTAADMLNGLRFLQDSNGREALRVPPVNAGLVRAFHRATLACIVAEANAQEEEPCIEPQLRSEPPALLSVSR